MSIDDNIKQIRAIGQTAKNGTADIVAFDEEAKKVWVQAIERFMQLLDGPKVKGKFEDIRKYADNVTEYFSATDTRDSLKTKLPDDLERTVKAYRDYLDDLLSAVNDSYNRLHNVDQS